MTKIPEQYKASFKAITKAHAAIFAKIEKPVKFNSFEATRSQRKAAKAYYTTQVEPVLDELDIDRLDLIYHLEYLCKISNLDYNFNLPKYAEMKRLRDELCLAVCIPEELQKPINFKHNLEAIPSLKEKAKKEYPNVSEYTIINIVQAQLLDSNPMPAFGSRIIDENGALRPFTDDEFLALKLYNK